jgi:SAM-dependent methyltransferase
MQEQSKIMQFFDRLGLRSIAWGLRRFHTPVSAEALVLEVGSGGNPYPRSNVLLDAYESSRERHWAPLTADRPTVLGFVENLPFKDKSFDYVIASHVLEHSSDPEKFISELQRVAKSGYIEVPDAFLERINPYKDHRLEISLRKDVLQITKKKNWIHEPEVVELYENRVKSYLTKILIPQRPFEFHVRYYWAEKINYVIKNPEVDASWEAPANDREYSKGSLVAQLKEFVRNLLRDFMSQRERNKKISVVPLLRCTR